MRLLILFSIMFSAHAWAGQAKCVAKCVKYSRDFKDVIVPVNGGSGEDLTVISKSKASGYADLLKACKEKGGNEVLFEFISEKYRNAALPTTSAEHIVSKTAFEPEKNCSDYTPGSPADKIYEVKDKSLLVPVKDNGIANED